MGLSVKRRKSSRIPGLPNPKAIHEHARSWVQEGKLIFPRQFDAPAKEFSLPYLKKGEHLVVIAGGTGEVASGIKHDNITFTDYNQEVVDYATPIFKGKGKSANFQTANGFSIHYDAPEADWLFDFEAFPLRQHSRYFLQLLKTKRGFFLADGSTPGLDPKYKKIIGVYGAKHSLHEIKEEGELKIVVHAVKTGEKVREKAKADELVFNALNSIKADGSLDLKKPRSGLERVRKNLGLSRLKFSESLKRLDKLTRLVKDSEYFEV